VELSGPAAPAGIKLAAGIILAGGAARRMGGGDKGLLPLAGRPILAHVIERLRPQLGALAISANGDPSRFAEWGLPVLPDTVPDQPGPLAGILAGLEWAASAKPEVAAIVTVPTDTPFLPRDLVPKLIAARDRSSARVAVARSGGRNHFVVALWPTDLAAELRRALTDEGVRKVEDFARRHRPAIAEFEALPIDPFFNVNRPEDLEAAEKWLA
jgi:molybdopterin-guanine dinucleotide biosynthesis protein A